MTILTNLLCKLGWHGSNYEWIEFCDNRLWKFTHCNNCDTILEANKLVTENEVNTE